MDTVSKHRPSTANPGLQYKRSIEIYAFSELFATFDLERRKQRRQLVTCRRTTSAAKNKWPPVCISLDDSPMHIV